MRYSYSAYDPKSFRGPAAYPPLDMQKKTMGFNGMHPGLNYSSTNLNRENKEVYKDLYSNRHPEAHSSYGPSSKYQSAGLSPGLPQFHRGQEGYRASGASHKNPGEMSVRK